MPFGLWSGIPDVITHAKFCVNRLRVSRRQRPENGHFLYLFERHLQQYCTVQTVMSLNTYHMLGSPNPIEIVEVLDVYDDALPA